MKRTLPLILKYFAVVGVSCFLAFVISQNLSSAGELAPALKAENPANTSSPASYVLPGEYRVETSRNTWRDAARARDVPVKLYFPLTGVGRSEAPEFPVILYSHGLGGNREGGNHWAEHWASHGFVVVAMQHAGSDEALWKYAATRDIEKSMKAGMTLGNLGLRVSDVRFVIDEVIRRSDAREAAFVNADPKRLGISGHSFGAQTTLAVAGQKVPSIGGQSGLDLRISAAIALSPNARNKNNLARQFGDITLPFFSITGSDDGSILGDGTKAGDRRLAYQNMPEGNKYLVVFEGGDHAVFGGNEFRQRRPETARDIKIRIDVKAGTLAFWNASLKQDAGARKWLEEGGFKATIGAKDIFEKK